jgi:hypothetical protein
MRVQIFILIYCLSLQISLEGAGSLREIRHFFPDEEQVPVAGDFAKPQFYHGSDVYSKPVEGPLYSRYGFELEIAPLFYLDRGRSGNDGRLLYYGFMVSAGVPLSRAYRPNHYLNLEVLGDFDSTDNQARIYSIEQQSLSILLNYKYYTPPLIRERVYPYLTFGGGNSFKSINTAGIGKSNSRSNFPKDFKGSDHSIITFHGGIGFRTRISRNFGLRTGYHLLFNGEQDYGVPKIGNKVYPVKRGSEWLHALDIGMSLRF